MKTVIYLRLVFLALIGLWSCSGQSSEKDEDVEWKEMDDFHMVMADVYHPLKDSGNLEPIRSRAEELAASASTWADASLPKKVDNDKVRGSLANLKAGTRELADQVKMQAADSVVQTKLTELHDQFHELQEAWYDKGEHHDH